MKIFIHKIMLVVTTIFSILVFTSGNNVQNDIPVETNNKINVEEQKQEIEKSDSDQQELHKEEQMKVEDTKETSTTSTTSTIKQDSNNNSKNNYESNNTVIEEKPETITETQKEISTPTQNNNSNNQNKSCGIWQSITNCKWDYDTSSACYSAGDHLTELYLNDWMDYNDSNPDNQVSRDIQNTECYSVDTENGTKWYLLVVCYSGTCSKNYKSIYLGK